MQLSNKILEFRFYINDLCYEKQCHNSFDGFKIRVKIKRLTIVKLQPQRVN